MSERHPYRHPFTPDASGTCTRCGWQEPSLQVGASADEAKRRIAELEVEIAGLRRSYWDERTERLKLAKWQDVTEAELRRELKAEVGFVPLERWIEGLNAIGRRRYG